MWGESLYGVYAIIRYNIVFKVGVTPAPSKLSFIN